jgi:hypothetical protein
MATAAAQTVAAHLTQSSGLPTMDTLTPTMASPTDTATPVSTPATPTPTHTGTPSPCTDKLAFVTDVTVPDNTYFPPGAIFIKTWRLRNSGTCPWTPEYALVFYSGNILSGNPVVPLGTTVEPNDTIEVSVELEAPAINGKYQGNWKLRNDLGVSFGWGSSADNAFWVIINVGPTPTPTATPTPTTPP